MNESPSSAPSSAASRPPSERWREAQQLQHSRLLTEIFDERRSDIVDTWIAADSAEKREAAHSALMALENLRELLYERIRECLAGDGRGTDE